MTLSAVGDEFCPNIRPRDVMPCDPQEECIREYSSLPCYIQLVSMDTCCAINQNLSLILSYFYHISSLSYLLASPFIIYEKPIKTFKTILNNFRTIQC